MEYLFKNIGVIGYYGIFPIYIPHNVIFLYLNIYKYCVWAINYY